jgi:hypothetical protein
MSEPPEEPDGRDSRYGGKPVSGEDLLKHLQGSIRPAKPEPAVPTERRSRPAEPASASAEPAAPSADEDSVRSKPVAALVATVLLAAGLGVGLLLAPGSDDRIETVTKSTTVTSPSNGAAAANDSDSSFTTNPETLRVPFKSLARGLPGDAMLYVLPIGGGRLHIRVVAKVPHSLYEVHLVKQHGSSKVLLSSRAGRAQFDSIVPVTTLTSRYVAMDILAWRLPRRPGQGRVRSLHINLRSLTNTIVDTKLKNTS